MRQQVVVETGEEFDRARVDRTEGHGVADGRVTLGEVRVFGAFQPALHVAERVLVGDELDETLAAVRVQRFDLGAGQRRRLGPHERVSPVGERVLPV